MLPFESMFDELEKLGAISADDARRSLDRLDSLEQNKPTLGQVASYGALGAAAGGATKLIGHAVEHGGLPTRRAGAAGAIAGAIGMGAVPLLRQKLDHKAEYGKLKKFMGQEHQGEFGADSGAMTDSPMSAGLSK